MLSPLTKEEFGSITERVTQGLQQKYAEDLLYVALKGSLARGEETPLSDVDVIAIVRTGGAKEHTWLYRSTTVDVTVQPLREVRKRLFNVDGLWPHVVGSFLVNRVLLDRANVRSNIRRWHDTVTQDGAIFRRACEYVGFFEYFSKVVRAREAGNAEVLRYAAWEIFFMSCMNVALLNRRYFYNHTTMIEQVETFDLVPAGFTRNARDIFHEDLQRVAEGAEGLFVTNMDLAREFGYERESANDVSAIRIP